MLIVLIKLKFPKYLAVQFIVASLDDWWLQASVNWAVYSDRLLSKFAS